MLKEGGLLFITTPQYWHVHGWPSDYYRYTFLGLKYLCESNGLKVVEIKPMGGPFALVFAVMRCNFPILGFLPIRLLFTYPMILLCDALDAVFVKDIFSRKHPDSRGWVVIAERPPMPVTS